MSSKHGFKNYRLIEEIGEREREKVKVVVVCLRTKILIKYDIDISTRTNKNQEKVTSQKRIYISSIIHEANRIKYITIEAFWKF